MYIKVIRQYGYIDSKEISTVTLEYINKVKEICELNIFKIIYTSYVLLIEDIIFIKFI